jgi:hypothetical protein
MEKFKKLLALIAIAAMIIVPMIYRYDKDTKKWSKHHEFIPENTQDSTKNLNQLKTN